MGVLKEPSAQTSPPYTYTGFPEGDTRHIPASTSVGDNPIASHTPCQVFSIIERLLFEV